MRGKMDSVFRLKPNAVRTHKLAGLNIWIPAHSTSLRTGRRQINPSTFRRNSWGHCASIINVLVVGGGRNDGSVWP